MTFRTYLATTTLAAALTGMTATVPAFAQEESSTTTATVDIACMQEAVDAREASLQSAASVYHAAIDAALNARGDALHVAWDIEVAADRREAIVTAWADYRTAMKDARSIYATAKTDAWMAYRTAAADCHGEADVSFEAGLMGRIGHWMHGDAEDHAETNDDDQGHPPAHAKAWGLRLRRLFNRAPSIGVDGNASASMQLGL